MLNINISQLFNIQLNLGHIKNKWLKYFDIFILGIRNNFIIFNLDFSILNLKKIINFLIYISFYHIKLFFISNFLNYNSKGLMQYIVRFNKDAGYYDGNFIGGLISNIKTFFFMKNLYKKKNVFNFRKLDYIYPSAVIVGDSNRFYLAIKECFLFGIPSISIIDSDLDFNHGFYLLYGNNDSKLITFFLCYYCNLSSLIGQYKLKKKIFFFNLRLVLFFFQLFIYILSFYSY